MRTIGKDPHSVPSKLKVVMIRTALGTMSTNAVVTHYAVLVMLC